MPGTCKLPNKYGMNLNFMLSVNHSLIPWLLVSTYLMLHTVVCTSTKTLSRTYLSVNSSRAWKVSYVSWDLQALCHTSRAWKVSYFSWDLQALCHAVHKTWPL